LTGHIGTIGDDPAKVSLDRSDAVFGAGHGENSRFPTLDRHAAKTIRRGSGAVEGRFAIVASMATMGTTRARDSQRLAGNLLRLAGCEAA
jgi:hypothetical protein